MDNFFSVIASDIKDRFQGNTIRANARWGMVSPPEGQSKLIWLRAGASHDSVLLAAGLLAAIRQKRQDVRLVLTYEEEYKNVIVAHLSGLNKIGFGYACADNANIESKMLSKLNPFAIIFCGTPAGEGIISAMEKNPVTHVINFQAELSSHLNPELHFASFRNKPNSESFEAMTLLMQAQVDKQLGALLCGESDRPIFLLNGMDEFQMQSFIKDWNESSLKDDAILCINPLTYRDDEIMCITDEVSNSSLDYIKLSEWNRQKPVDKEIIVLDEWRWFAAIAASAIAIHLTRTDSAQFWQSLASATAISIDEHCELPVDVSLPVNEKTPIVSYWQKMLENTFKCRQLGDENRRLFWDYRRQAQHGIDTLLQRIFDW